MTPWQHIQAKLPVSLEKALAQREIWRQEGKRVVFTNGCFDLLHYGHLHYLAEARELGDALVIGLNSATSVRRLKGPHRPINDELTRLHQLASLAFVDMVLPFEADTPLELILALQPDVLVKGGDWPVEKMVGAKEVLAWGGHAQTLPFVAGYSTTRIEEKILQSHRLL